MARFAFAAIAFSVLRASNALEIITPSQDLQVEGGRTYTVEWTGGGNDNRFDIDLYYCGSICTEDECGEWVTALCPYAETGCPDDEGDYDIVMPEPMSGTSGSGYKVRVMDVDDESSVDCSDDFILVASEEVPPQDDPDGPYLMVTAPAEDDEAEAGEEYTVEFDYDNGLGSRVGRFSIDLYEVDGSGDCGTWFATICDKPSIGCKDSMGDYDVVIPEDTPLGMYRIRVGVFDDETLFDCSDEFEIVDGSNPETGNATDDDGGDDDDDDDMSLSFLF